MDLKHIPGHEVTERDTYLSARWLNAVKSAVYSLLTGTTGEINVQKFGNRVVIGADSSNVRGIHRLIPVKCAVILQEYDDYLWCAPFSFTVDTPQTYNPYLGQYVISAASWSAGVVTITTAINHGFVVGTQIRIQNANPSGYNGNYAVATVISATQFTIAIVSNPGTFVPGCGTIINLDSAFYVAKPELLQRTPWDKKLVPVSEGPYVVAGGTYVYYTYSPPPIGQRMAKPVIPETDGDCHYTVDGDGNYVFSFSGTAVTEYITQPYMAGDVIEVNFGLTGYLDPNDNPINWTDANNGGRSWEAAPGGSTTPVLLAQLTHKRYNCYSPPSPLWVEYKAVFVTPSLEAGCEGGTPLYTPTVQVDMPVFMYTQIDYPTCPIPGYLDFNGDTDATGFVTPHSIVELILSPSGDFYFFRQPPWEDLFIKTPATDSYGIIGYYRYWSGSAFTSGEEVRIVIAS